MSVSACPQIRRSSWISPTTSSVLSRPPSAGSSTMRMPLRSPGSPRRKPVTPAKSTDDGPGTSTASQARGGLTPTSGTVTWSALRRPTRTGANTAWAESTGPIAGSSAIRCASPGPESEQLGSPSAPRHDR